MVHAWASIPCTAGCRWRSANVRKGAETGDMPKTIEMIDVVCKFIRQVVAVSGSFTWEWPSTSQLWKLPMVQDFINRIGDSIEARVISHATVGGELVLKGVSVCVRKSYRIWTTSSGIKLFLAGLAIPESRNSLEFVECGGALTKQTSAYPPNMVEKIWKGLLADIASLRPPPALIMQGSSPQQVQPQHQPQDARPVLPLWCALVTRIVNLSSTEAKCDGARAALDKERDGLMKANTFDMNNPREYSDLMRDNKIDEAMFGRVFMILGKKNTRDGRQRRTSLEGPSGLSGE